jgi:hypothetical protein
MAQNNTQHSPMKHSKAQNNATQHGTEQYDTPIKHNKAQNNTAQNRIEKDRT